MYESDEFAQNTNHMKVVTNYEYSIHYKEIVENEFRKQNEARIEYEKIHNHQDLSPLS